jgi:hypothetical protein
MSLESLDDKKYTDKNTKHSYLPLYNKLLEPIKDTANIILEIGIGDFKDKNGGSLLLWRKYFTKADICGVDILPENRVLDILVNDEKVILFTEKDAYNQNFVDEYLKEFKFDFILDDGPHTLESQKKFIELYLPLLSKNGILIIEDIPNISWINEFKKITPSNLQQYIEVYDLRENKGRYDDIVFVINKIKK